MPFSVFEKFKIDFYVRKTQNILTFLNIKTRNVPKTPAPNEAVWRNGGSSPREVQCDFGSLSPARSSVEAATTPSRWDVRRQRRRCYRLSVSFSVEKM
jgi:hypothetical protein